MIRARRNPKAGRPELRPFLRRQPLMIPVPQPDPVAPEREKAAKTASGPQVAPQSPRKRTWQEAKVKRKRNRGAYSGQ